jgi:outer membrane protein assembly factor BamB
MLNKQHAYLSLSVSGSGLVLSNALLVFLLAFATVGRANDWPRWRGPAIDGISKETGWLAQWPQGGPKRLWEGSVGVGYSSFSVSQGRVYTLGNVKEVDTVFCFDAESGKDLWKHEYPCSSKDPNGYHGTRCTPTVDGDRVYTVSREGHFFCFDAAQGTVIWSKEFKKDFGANPPTWGYAGSPLIEKDWVLYEVGAGDAAVVAFNKKTGAVEWKNGSDGAGYSSLIPFDLGGERMMAVFPKDNFVVRRMKDGSEVGRIPWKTSYGVNAATPIIDGKWIFISSGYGYGCALLEVSAGGLKEVWRNKNMRNHVNSCVVWQGYLYGFDEGELKCLDYKTGEVKWGTKAFGKGSLTLADGKLILYSQTGKLATAEPSPDGYKEISSVQILTGKDTWAVPVLANGRIYCRSLEKMVCLDVKGQ